MRKRRTRHQLFPLHTGMNSLKFPRDRKQVPHRPNTCLLFGRSQKEKESRKRLEDPLFTHCDTPSASASAVRLWTCRIFESASGHVGNERCQPASKSEDDRRSTRDEQ